MNQRKGKIITIYDLKLKMDWVGEGGEDEKTNGTLTMEMENDVTPDEFPVGLVLLLISYGNFEILKLIIIKKKKKNPPDRLHMHKRFRKSEIRHQRARSQKTLKSRRSQP